MTPILSQITMEGQQANANRETRNFIIHENIMRMSSQLDNEELARFFRHVYRYVESGQMPEEEPSCAVNIIFNEWRLRYEADKERYEEVSQKRREAGRKGVNKRWNKNGSTAQDTGDSVDEENAPTATSTVTEQPRTEAEGEGKLEIRKDNFYQSILPYAGQYDREMLNDFFQYWTELDKRRRRMRFEMQKTWETGKRLNLWSRKQFT